MPFADDGARYTDYTSPMALIDTHCHVSYADFDADRAEVLARAKAAGVLGLINVATDPEWWPRYLALAAEAHPDEAPAVKVALGFHPNYATKFGPEAFAELRRLFERHPGVAIAVGETGLDTFRDYCPLEAQAAAFQAQLDLAAERDLPFILHCRNEERRMCEMLARQRDKLGRPLRGVWHCFTANTDHMQQAVALGLHLGVGGVATYPKAEEVRAALREAPLERLILETDAPYLAPQPRRGKRNEPAFVAMTCERVAAALGHSAEEFAARTTANARALFRAF
ncbi:MAG: TatD family hydrolase [Planctomycetota bacterium]|nr:TatD family hydrolase [Planctomycetota bacterium]